MPRFPEHNLQTKIVQFVREWCATPHEFAAHDRSRNQGMQHVYEARRGIRKGWPDTELVLMGGKTFRCELKILPNRPDEWQEAIIERLSILGHPTAWAWSVTSYYEAALAAGVKFRNGAEIRAKQLDVVLGIGERVPKPRKARQRLDDDVPDLCA